MHLQFLLYYPAAVFDLAISLNICAVMSVITYISSPGCNFSPFLIRNLQYEDWHLCWCWQSYEFHHSDAAEIPEVVNIAFVNLSVYQYWIIMLPVTFRKITFFPMTYCLQAWWIWISKIILGSTELRCQRKFIEVIQLTVYLILMLIL